MSPYHAEPCHPCHAERSRSRSRRGKGEAGLEGERRSGGRREKGEAFSFLLYTSTPLSVTVSCQAGPCHPERSRRGKGEANTAVRNNNDEHDSYTLSMARKRD